MPSANEVTDRFRLKLANGMRLILPIWPPSSIRRSQVATVQMRQLVDESPISGFSREDAIQQKFEP